MGDPLNTPCVPADGVREAHGMHLWQRGPWVGPGVGMVLKVGAMLHWWWWLHHG